MLERLQKILSARGVCSRRKAEEYLDAGLVRVNGRVVKVGDKADALVDRIEVDGKVLEDRAKMLYYVMNKPVGVETTNVEHAHSESNLKTKSGKQEKIPQLKAHSSKLIAPSVRDVLPPALQGKVYPVGRLDKDSSGLLLFTNDGVLAYRLTHPKFDHEKEYEVTVDRPIDQATCKKIAEGFMMDGSMTKPLVCKKVASTRAQVILTEGKNRQIRRMFQQSGYTVKELRRMRIMTLRDDSLKAGSVRSLTEVEKKKLLESVGL
jgi:23S rRNA pseudouridine2605 synthase/23S rRNA pseudouridine2604 synthase